MEPEEAAQRLPLAGRIVGDTPARTQATPGFGTFDCDQSPFGNGRL